MIVLSDTPSPPKKECSKGLVFKFFIRHLALKVLKMYSPHLLPGAFPQHLQVSLIEGIWIHWEALEAVLRLRPDNSSSDHDGGGHSMALFTGKSMGKIRKSMETMVLFIKYGGFLQSFPSNSRIHGTWHVRTDDMSNFTTGVPCKMWEGHMRDGSKMFQVLWHRCKSTILNSHWLSIWDEKSTRCDLGHRGHRGHQVSSSAFLLLQHWRQRMDQGCKALPSSLASVDFA